jgi:ABC-2 type transport system ATP-binding protein
MDMLVLNSLKKNFSDQKAVDDVSLSIREGDIFGLLGPNGAGKTTLLRMITGIFKPDEGQILFRGLPFDAEEHSRHIGYMPEERGLYKKMKIGEQLLFLAQLKGLNKKEAEKNIGMWFEKLGMESWWNKKVEDLSKGMSQKLQFVATVAHEPSLIILDEPFSGLDPVNANLIKEEIFQLAKKGATIIFSTHRMEQVEEICNHIVLINKGQKILDGNVQQIKQDFKENVFELGVNAMAEQLMTALFEVIRFRKDEMLIKLLHDTRNNDVLRYFIERNVDIRYFREVLPTLNEIFIRLVEGTETARSFQPLNHSHE